MTSHKEKTIITAVLQRFKTLYPVWMERTVAPYLDDLQDQTQTFQGFNFSSLLGETQQGKTLVMHLLTWIMCHVHGYTPCYITKKLTSLRDDAMDKLSGGAVNDIVTEVCMELGYPEHAKAFHLSGHVGIRITGTISKGQVPIYLMQPENNTKVLQWMKDAAGTGPAVFFIDEVHELYSIKTYLQSKGLDLAGIKNNRIHNHALIHMIAKACRDMGCSMLGITATPQRMLTSDPEIYPQKLYTIPCMPPVTGLVRVGYMDQHDEYQGAEFNASTDVLDVLNAIMQREPVMLSTGQIQVRFLNITVDHYNANMAAMYDLIMENYSTSEVYARLFVQKTAETVDINVETLDQFFDMRQVPDSVLTNGVVVLIGKSREAAGITIKPSFTIKHLGWHKRSIGDVEYVIDGITDMMVKLPSNMETAEQLFGRASGWYDKYHRLHFWLPEKQIHDVRTGIVLTKRSLINNYDGQQGPKSVLSVQNMCTSMTYFTPNNNYSSSQRRGAVQAGLYSEPPNGIELGTTVTKLPDSLWQEYLRVCDLPGRGRTASGRAVHKSVKQYSKHSDFLHIPWDKDHSRLITRMAVQPREGNRWRVNAYVQVTDTAMYLICFHNSWDQRQQFGYECAECDTGGCSHINPSQTIYWAAAEYMFVQASYSREMTHRYSTAINNWNLSDEHTQVIDTLGKIVSGELQVIRRKSFYALFTRLHTLRKLNSTRPSHLAHQTWISQRWKAFKDAHEELYESCDKLVREWNETESRLLSCLDTMLSAYFLPRPLPKLQAKLRLPTYAPTRKLKVKLRT